MNWCESDINIAPCYLMYTFVSSFPQCGRGKEDSLNLELKQGPNKNCTEDKLTM